MTSREVLEARARKATQIVKEGKVAKLLSGPNWLTAFQNQVVEPGISENVEGKEGMRGGN